MGVRQGECLSPFLFSIYLNDIETDFINNECQSIDIELLKVFLMLYADDIVIFTNDEQGLQKGLDVLHNYWYTAVTAKLICVFVFAYAKSRFSQYTAQIKSILFFLN